MLDKKVSDMILYLSSYLVKLCQRVYFYIIYDFTKICGFFVMSINLTKQQLADAVELYDHLSSELDNKNVEAFTDEQWQTRLRTIGLETVQFAKKVQSVHDATLLDLINKKQHKLKRHASWKKRNKKQKLNLKRKRQRWIKNIEWKVIALEEQKQKKDEKQDKQNLKVKELTQILSKLVQLRTLRRKRLEAKGHFFPEEGDTFYEQIKELNQKNIESQSEEEEKEESNQHDRDKLTLDPQDKWNYDSMDEKTYRYWTCQSADSLLKVRRMWDQYITEEGGDKIPPTFVSPSAPANSIWASYLY